MSFLAPKVENPLIDATPSRQTIARDGLALPLVLGRGRVAVQWITPVLHWRYRTTSRSSYAFFSALGELCLGPVDEIARIIVNGKGYDGVFIRREDSVGDYIEHVLAKETPETFRFYWGTETQSAAGITAYAQSLVKSAGHTEAAAVHPGYHGRCLIGVQDMEAGQASSGFTPALPQVEVELYRRAPVTYSFGHLGTGTHPLGAIYEILTDKRGGLGLPPSLFDSAAWSAAFTRLHNDGIAGRAGTDLWISAVVSERRPASQVLADALAYIDGWLSYRNGKIGVDWFPNDGSTTSPTGLRELSWHDMIGQPRLEPEGLDDIVTSIAVEGLDWDNEEDPLSTVTEVAQVPYAQQLVGEPRQEKISRPWYVTREQLRALAAVTAQMRASPRLMGSASFRRESCTQLDGTTPLLPGDRFNLDYTPYGLDIVCRITERTESEDRAEVTLKFISERGASPTPYLPPTDPRVSAEQPDPQAAAYWTVVEAPPDLELAAGPSAIVLAERANTYTSNWRLHFATTNTWPGEIILDDSLWAISGTVSVGLSNTTSPGTLRLSIASAEVGLLISQTATEQEDNRLLIYAGGEWLSVGTITPVGGGLYDFAVLRGRLGSSTRAIGTSERCYAIYRAAVPIVAHANFANVGVPYNGTTATKWFKLHAYSGAKEASISAAISRQFADRAPAAPTSFTATALAGAVKLSWTCPDDANIFGYQIYQNTVNTLPASPGYFVAHAGNVFTATGLNGGTTYYFWIVAVTYTIKLSTVVGSVNTTPTTGGAGAPGADGVGSWLPVENGAATMEGSDMFKRTGSAAWDASVYSQDGFYRGAFVAATVGALANAAIGLDTTPGSAVTNTSIDYCFRLWSGNQIDIMESGSTVATAVAVAVANVTRLAIVYDNASVRYYVNGSLVRTSTVAADQTLFLDSSLWTVDASNALLKNVVFAATGAVGSPGSPGTNGLNVATVYLFRRASSTPALPSTTATYTFSTGVLTGHNNSWTQAVPAGTDPLYVTTATASATTATDTIAGGEWAAAQVLAQNGANGTGYAGTSTTSLTIGTGSKSLTTQTGLAYSPGQTVRLIYTSNSGFWLEGIISSYDSGTGAMVFNASLYQGSGTFAAWNVTNVGMSGTGGTPDGVYVAGATYYCNSVRQSIVYVGTNAYRAVNPAKDGLTTWGTPGSSSDWAAPDATYKFVASDLALVRDQAITKTLVMGDGSSGAGIIRWNTATNFSTGYGIWMGYDGSTIKARFGDPAGRQLSITPAEISLGADTITTINTLLNTDDNAVRTWQGYAAPDKGVYVQRKDGVATTVGLHSAGSSCMLRASAYGGASYSAPSATPSGRRLRLDLFVHDGSAPVIGTEIVCETAENISSTTRGTHITFSSYANGAPGGTMRGWRMQADKLSVGDVFGYTQVLSTRRTGWAAATGTATRSTFDAGTVTTPQLAERVKALLDDLTAHGIIGA
jgi:hypothetical protein